MIRCHVESRRGKGIVHQTTAFQVGSELYKGLNAVILDASSGRSFWIYGVNRNGDSAARHHGLVDSIVTQELIELGGKVSRTRQGIITLATTGHAHAFLALKHLDGTTA